MVCARLDRAGADDLAERIAAAIAAPISLDVGTVTVGASVGVSVLAPDLDPVAVLREADEAMYERKRHRHSATADPATALEPALRTAGRDARATPGREGGAP